MQCSTRSMQECGWKLVLEVVQVRFDCALHLGGHLDKTWKGLIWPGTPHSGSAHRDSSLC